MTFAARPVLVTSGVVSPLNITDAIRTTVSPTVATATVDFNSDGTGTSTAAISGTNSWSWYSPTTTNIGSSFWIRATLVSGTTPTSGTMNTWISLSTGPNWSNTLSGTGFRVSEIQFDIATDSAGTNIVATDASVTITAEVDI
jgi:hypothetical protein